jgi:sugar/nucleoside kinase (ribokinase family)
MKDRSICVIGDAFFDIIVPIENITKGGAFQRNLRIFPGGTANVSVWASRLGINSKFVGKIGSDLLGFAYKKDLVSENVIDLTIMDKDDHPTGICISLVDENGERTMITNRGANDFWTMEEMNSNIDGILSSSILYVTGFSLISSKNFKVLSSILRRASKEDIQIWFNPGASNIIDKRFRKLITRYVYGLILNLDEAKQLTNEDGDDVKDELKKLVDFFVLTMGEKGCIVFENNKNIFTPAYKVKEIVDTTGAGDAFAAGFLAGLLKGSDAEECSKLGHKIAAEVIQRYGAR